MSTKTKTYGQMNEYQKEDLKRVWEMLEVGELMEDKFSIKSATVTHFDPELTRWQNACDNMRINHNLEWSEYCKTQAKKQTDLTQQAEATIDLSNKTLSELKELEKIIVSTLNNAPVKLDGENEIKANLEAVRTEIYKMEATDLTQQAAALVDAKWSKQYDFICQAPEGEWRELLEIIFEGADPTMWERKRASYKSDWQTKATKKAQKRKKNRQRYAKNGGSVYSLKRDRLNGTVCMLPLAQV